MTPTPSVPQARPSNTKIVATIGPASDAPSQLVDLILAGVDVFRINTAHGQLADHQRRVAAVRTAEQASGRPVAILLDLAGPKMRLGELPDGQLECVPNDTLRFVRGQSSTDPKRLVTTYEPLVDELQPGDRVMLADGMVSLLVEGKEPDAAVCRVVQGGLIRSRQGVNLPGVKLSVPALNEKDVEVAHWAASAEVDFLGLSFVRRPEDIDQLRAILQEHHSTVQIIAKIEKPEAVANLEAIIAASDGVMVARGDLGVETDIARVPLVQKEIIAACHRARKPVITATQMLESMHHSRLPTRAEASDVANAILDGADACMLSGETAIGEYPRETVEMMHRIALATEAVARLRPLLPDPDLSAPNVNPITEAVTHAAGEIAEQVGAKMLLVVSASGQTALSISKNRNFVPTLGVSPSQATLRRMCLYWGVIPLANAPTDDTSQLVRYVAQRGLEASLLVPGDRMVVIAGTGLRSTRHNVLFVHELE